MTTRSDLDRSLGAWFQAGAGEGTPDYLDEIVERVAREPQRAWWSSPERWLPMDTVARLQPAPRMVWFLVLLALVVALGAAALAIVGSSPSPAVPLLGLARNGPVIYSRDGDIFR